MRKQNKNNKVLVFGHGQIADFVPQYFNDVFISRSDITKPEELEKDLVKYKPGVVINTAAKTSIDWCEQNKLEAFNINTLGALKVWESCQKHSIFLVHFSSGCIFSSKSTKDIYSEKDTPNPACFYSWTKVWAENLLGKSPNLLIVRPRVIISSKVDRRNTLSKWLVYSHFISDENTVTIIEDMMPILRKMVDRRICGIYHVANKGTVSPLKVAYLLKKTINPGMKIHTTNLSEVNRNLVAKRVTTILSTEELKKQGFELPHVNEAIPTIIERFKQNLIKVGGISSLDAVRKEAKEKYRAVSGSPTTFLDEN